MEMIPWTACCNQTWSSSIRIHFLTRAHWHLLPGQIKRRQEAWLCRDAQSGRGSVWDLRAGDDHSTDIVTILVKARIRGGLGQQPAQVPTNIGLWQFVRKLLNIPNTVIIWAGRQSAECRVKFSSSRESCFIWNCYKNDTHWEETIAVI